MITIAHDNTKSHVMYFAVIFLVTLGIYWNSLQGDFIWDDRGLILESTSYLGDWRNIFSSFTKPFFGNTPFYRPLLLVSFIVDYQLWELNPFGFHLSNVLLHALNACMVYLLAFLLFKQRPFAFIAGLLFTTHPIQTEAVAWISGRNDVLLTFFSLITIICYLQWRNHAGRKQVFCYCGFILSYCCVLLTKESGIILPILIALIDYFCGNNPLRNLAESKKIYLPLISTSVLYLCLRMYLLGSTDVAVNGLNIFQTIVVVISTYAYYFTMLLFPAFQTASPPITSLVVSVTNPAFISSCVLVGALGAVTVLCWKRFRELSFLILWIFVALIPVSGIISLNVPALEHRLCLASVFFSMVIPLILYKTLLACTTEFTLSNRSLWNVLFILLPLVVVYSSKTVTRNTIWKNEHTFWFNTVQDSPSSLFARNNLGIVFACEGKHKEAILIFKQALSLPNNEGPEGSAAANGIRRKLYNNLGRSYRAMLEGSHSKKSEKR